MKLRESLEIDDSKIIARIQRKCYDVPFDILRGGKIMGTVRTWAKLPIRQNRPPKDTNLFVAAVEEHLRVKEHPNFPSRSKSIFASAISTVARGFGPTALVMIPMGATVASCPIDSAGYIVNFDRDYFLMKYAESRIESPYLNIFDLIRSKSYSKAAELLIRNERQVKLDYDDIANASSTMTFEAGKYKNMGDHVKAAYLLYPIIRKVREYHSKLIPGIPKLASAEEIIIEHSFYYAMNEDWYVRNEPNPNL